MQEDNFAAVTGDPHAIGDLVSTYPDDPPAVKDDRPAATQEAENLAIGEVVGQGFAMPTEAQRLKALARPGGAERKRIHFVSVDICLPGGDLQRPVLR